MVALAVSALAGCTPPAARAGAVLPRPQRPLVTVTADLITVGLPAGWTGRTPIPLGLSGTVRMLPQADDGLAVLDADGGLLAALGPPRHPDDAAPVAAPVTIGYVVDAGQVSLTVTDPSQPSTSKPSNAPSNLDPTTTPGPGPLEVRIEVGHALIDDAHWTEVAGRRGLAVTPSAWQRRWPNPQVAAAAWREVVRAEPEADTPGMADQYTCHAVFAPTKDVFNLEPWRPDVGYLATLASACNPGPVPDADRDG